MSGELADEAVDVKLVRGAEIGLRIGDGLLLIVHQFQFEDSLHSASSVMISRRYVASAVSSQPSWAKRILGHAALDDPAQHGRSLGVELGNRRRLIGDDGGHRLRR